MANDFRAQTSYLRGILAAGFKQEMDLLQTCRYNISSDMAGAKTMTIRGVTGATLAAYTGADLTAARATINTDTLTLDVLLAATIRIQRADYEGDAQLKELLSRLAKKWVIETKQAINTEICNQYAVATSLYSDSDPITLTPANVWVRLNEFVVAFDKANVPIENRVIVIPPIVSGLIKNVQNLKNIAGSIDATIISCNQISSTGSGDTAIYRLLGYSKEWLLAGLGIDDVGFGDIGELNFGQYAKALIVYGVDPATNVIGTLGWSMSSMVDNSILN
jgi:hypothetical protein